MTTMLPSLPTTFGRLTDVFASALGAVTGTDNRLGFRPAKHALVILVDGLGAHNLKGAAGHAPFLNGKLNTAKPISCGFPSTTVASITSFATGLRSGSHGLIGYQVFDRDQNLAVNLLTGWGDKVNPIEWQPNQTVSELALKAGVKSFVVGPADYADSGFTRATMRSAKYLAANDVSSRFEKVKEIFRHTEPTLSYLYVPELDQAAHAFGADSEKWLARLEEVDSEVRKLAEKISADCLVVLTADHGIIDVPSTSHIYLDELPAIQDQLLNVGGDPRVNFVYLKDAAATETIAKHIAEFVGDFGYVVTRGQMLKLGWYGDLSSRAKSLLPEIFVIARKTVAFYHRGFAKPQSLKMIGQHGALSAQELMVPLLVF
ncbi:MAG: alkaline phosphatase family protein [Micrococcales bacterium]